MPRIYCAGPLFNAVEQQAMAAIAEVLERAGHETYLPQRDGLEAEDLILHLRRAAGADEAARRIHYRAIFALDVQKLLEWSDVVVANLNGRVPDEGTVVECALAWHAGKGLVVYKADARAPFEGHDNPMLTELAGGRPIGAIQDLPDAVRLVLSTERSSDVDKAVALGRRVAAARESEPDSEALSRALVRLLAG